MNQEAWLAVANEIEATRDLHLRDLFAKDPGRAERFTLNAAGWTLDYSKNRITPDTLAHVREVIGALRAADVQG